MWGPRRTIVRFQEPTTLPVKSPTQPRKEKYPSKWASWKDLCPAEDYYAGAIQGATVRTQRHCQEVQLKQRTDQTQQ